MRHVFEPQPLHLLVEGRAVDAQLLGRQLTIPVMAFQHFQNDLTLGGFTNVLRPGGG